MADLKQLGTIPVVREVFMILVMTRGWYRFYFRTVFFFTGFGIEKPV